MMRIPFSGDSRSALWNYDHVFIVEKWRGKDFLVCAALPA